VQILKVEIGCRCKMTPCSVFLNTPPGSLSDAECIVFTFTLIGIPAKRNYGKARAYKFWN